MAWRASDWKLSPRCVTSGGRSEADSVILVRAELTARVLGGDGEFRVCSALPNAFGLRCRRGGGARRSDSRPSNGFDDGAAFGSWMAECGRWGGRRTRFEFEDSNARASDAKELLAMVLALSAMTGETGRTHASTDSDGDTRGIKPEGGDDAREPSDCSCTESASCT
jgi:hypothetical protein